MILTESRIEDVLRTGEARHSPIAGTFIREAERRFGMRIAACYLQADTHIDLPPGVPFERFIRMEPVPFVREHILTVYADSRFCRPADKREGAWEELFALLEKIRCEADIPLESPRLYLPEEMRYYGWNQTKRENWDFSRVIETAEPSRECHDARVEYIDKLALWQYLQDGLPSVRRCPAIREAGVQVFCGYDPGREGMAYFLIVPGKIQPESAENLRRSFAQYAAEVLQKRDRWGVIDEESVSPVAAEKDALTPAQRFALYKE